MAVVSVKKNLMLYFNFFMSDGRIGGMKRYKLLDNSECLGCGKWLCVMAGTYTGEIQCRKCGTINVFRDSAKPCEAKAA